MLSSKGNINYIYRKFKDGFKPRKQRISSVIKIIYFEKRMITEMQSNYLKNFMTHMTTILLNWNALA